MQPHITGDNTLRLLHELDIVDKHRLLIAAVSTMDKWGVDVLKGHTMWFNEDRFVPLEIGYEIVNISTNIPQGLNLGIDVAFGKPEIAEGNLVLNSLKQMTNLVEGIVSQFEGFLV